MDIDERGLAEVLISASLTGFSYQLRWNDGILHDGKRTYSTVRDALANAMMAAKKYDCDILCVKFELSVWHRRQYHNERKEQNGQDC